MVCEWNDPATRMRSAVSLSRRGKSATRLTALSWICAATNTFDGRHEYEIPVEASDVFPSEEPARELATVLTTATDQIGQLA